MFSFSVPGVPNAEDHPLVKEVLEQISGDLDEESTELQDLLLRLRDQDPQAFFHLKRSQPLLEPIVKKLPELSRSSASPEVNKMRAQGRRNRSGNNLSRSSDNLFPLLHRSSSYVDSMLMAESRSDNDEGSEVSNPMEVFDHLDTEGNGVITQSQFVQYFKEMSRSQGHFRKRRMPQPHFRARANVSLKAWVRSHQGDKPIHRLLIANNGLAAVKAIRSIREWAENTFQNPHIISMVCMATAEDLKSNAEFIRMSDELIEVPGGSNAHNYANIQVIVNTAIRTNCDAVWAGWGHASENPDLPRALHQNQLIWLGPGGEAMESLGDKIRSTLIAQNCGVNVLPWSGDGIEGWDDHDFNEACVQTALQARKVIERIGLPVMIKASEGGGGKGIRTVTDISQVEAAFRQVCAEVPGSPVFIMKLGHNVRHVEVQLLADNYGNTIAIYGRDCSIQRRHQKIIEEGPVAAANSQTMKAMMDAAISLAQQVGYIGAGTVEYLLFEDGKYCFLELNPRLQVEHGVTELLSGVNIPACQVMVAMGIPLYCIGSIRRLYGHDANSCEPINFVTAKLREPKRSIIACRITAENPADGFRPTTGHISELILRPRPQTFGYFSMKPGSAIHEFADSQFGHIFAVGSSRESARVNMINTLRDLDIMGEISTNIEFLQFVLETPDYRKNRVTTEWLEKLDWKKEEKTEVIVILGVVVSVHKAFKEAREQAIDDVTRGRSLIGRSMDSLAIAELFLIYKGVKYEFLVERTSDLEYLVFLNSRNSEGWCTPLEIRSIADGGFLISLNCRTYVVYSSFKPSGLRIRVDGEEFNFDNEYDPSVLKAEMSGKLVNLLVKNGAHIDKDEVYAEIEVMKMILTMKSPESGCIEFKVSEGSVLQSGDVLANLKLDDPDKVRKTDLFERSFPEMGLPHEPTNKMQETLSNSIAALTHMMKGYNFTRNSNEIKQRISAMVNCLRDPMMPAHEFLDALASVKGKIPKSLFRKLQVVCQEYCDSATSSLFPWEKPQAFPVNEINHALQAFMENEEEKGALEKVIVPIRTMLEKWTGGAGTYANNVFLTLLDSFFETEKYFCGLSNEESLRKLRADHNSDEMVDYLFGHSRLDYRVPLVLEILDIIENIFQERLFQYIQNLSPMLERLMHLTDTPYAQVHIKCRSIKMQQSISTKYERWMVLEQNVRMKSLKGAAFKHADLFGLLPRFMTDADKALRANATEIFINRVYKEHCVEDIHVEYDSGVTVFALSPIQVGPHAIQPPEMCGVVGIFHDLGQCISKGANIVANLDQATKLLKKADMKVERVMSLFFIVVLEPPRTLPSAKSVISKLEAELKLLEVHLKSKDVKQVDVLMYHTDDHQEFYTFSSALGYKEDRLKRHIPPPVAATFEIDRFSDLEIRSITRDGDIYVYEAASENGKTSSLFARSNICPKDERVSFASLITLEKDIDKLIYQFELAMFEVLIAIEKVLEKDRNKYNDNHIMLIYEYDHEAVFGEIDQKQFQAAKKSMNHAITKAMERVLQRVTAVYFSRYFQALDQCKVHQLELVCKAANISRPPPPVRIVVEVPYRRCCKIYPYLEFVHGGQRKFSPIRDLKGPYDGVVVDQTMSGPKHAISSNLSQRRITVKRVNSVYAYDWEMLYQQALCQTWTKLGHNEETFVTSKELILNKEENGLIEIDRKPGENDIGMVAWRMKLKTPEYPEGRDIILVSNDLAVKVGTFGVAEDELFNQASILAREDGIPFVYMSCNSGARIGLAKELIDCFKVAWVAKEDDDDMAKGFEYLYLSAEDFEKNSEYVVCKEIEVDGEKRYVLTAIIGEEHGLSVENLSGSGKIAGELSRAYDETVTIQYVSGRSVGIGAYLNRLGQRIIQKSGSPIILTGYQALNNLLGKEVYLSHVQLGGLGIMVPNGVCHIPVQDDLAGVEAIINWLSYIPKTTHDVMLPPLDCTLKTDPVDRDVTFDVPPAAYDPKSLITGCEVDGERYDGLFDKDSFTETLAGWAGGIVVGRARLGGIPCGVIVVDTRPTTKVIPPDPANEDSNEQVFQRAGKVWFPDSSMKTANTIDDMNREGLPLMILANWRGFSGGASDMFNEVLKYGAKIVDALRVYKQPVMVYIPPHAEVRGGAWVVIDTQINPEFIEMYASETARGGVLESTGTAGLKFKSKALNKMIKRLDPKLENLQKLDATPDVEKEMRQRQQLLTGLYKQVAIEFADLHDRPERMLAKGVIREIIPWANSRRYFFWRLRLRLHLLKVFKKIDGVTMNDVNQKFDTLITKALGAKTTDESICRWCDDNEAELEKLKSELQQEVIMNQVSALACGFPGGIEALMKRVQTSI